MNNNIITVTVLKYMNNIKNEFIKPILYRFTTFCGKKIILKTSIIPVIE